MKYRLFIVALLFSQMLFSQGFKGGLMGGMVVSQIDGDQIEGYHKAGLQTGIYTQYLFNDQWSIVMEIKYIQKGSLHTDKDNPYSYFRIKLNYIELPFLLEYKLNKSFIFGAGLAYGNLLSAKVDDASGSIVSQQLSYKKTDVNIVGQVKYAFNEHYWIDLKMAYSILPITNQSPFQFNNLISFGIGYEI